MSDELSILVGVKFDPKGIEKINSELNTLVKSKKNVTIGVNTGTASRSIKLIEQKIQGLRELVSKPLDLTVSSGNITSALTSISSAVNKSIDAINKLNSSISSLGSKGDSSGIGKIVSQLNELSNAVKSLNFKDLNVTNVTNLSTSKIASQTKNLTAYKEEAKELLSIVTQLRDATATGYSALMKGALAKGNRDSLSDKLFTLIDASIGGGKDAAAFNETKFAGRIAGAETTSTIKKVIGELLHYKEMAEEINKLAGNPLSFDKIDTSRFEEIQRQINAGTEDAKKLEDTLKNATMQGTNNAGNASSQAEDQVKLNVESIQNSFQELNNLFDQLKTKINETFDFSNAISGVGQLKQALEDLGGTLSELQKNSAAVIEQAKQQIAQQAQNTSNQTNNASNMPSNLPNASGDTKYWDELNSAIQRYSSAFDDVEAKVSRWHISEDMQGNARATVEFKNSLGEVTTAMFRLQDVVDENGTSKKDWVPVGESYSKSFQTAEQAARKMYDELNRGYRESEKQAEQQYQMYEKMFAQRERETQKEIQMAEQAARKMYDELNKGYREGEKQTEQQYQMYDRMFAQREKEIQNSTNYFSKQESEFNKLYSTAFDPKSPLTGEFADKALDALQKYQDEYQNVMKTGTVATDEQKRKIEELRQAATLAIKEQQSLQQQFNTEKKQDYSGLFGQSKEWEAALKQITDAENKLNEIQKSAFSGTNALTGDFAKEATNQIDEVKSKFAEIRKVAEESFGGATTVSKDEMNRMIKELESSLNRLAKIEYPSDKLAAQNVDVKKMFASDGLDEMEQKLKNLSLDTSEYAEKLQNLRDRLSEVGKVDSDPSAWANWRNEFHLLEGEINKFESSVQGMGQSLASSTESGQLQGILDIVDRLNNIDEQFSGEGVARLQESLQSLAIEYINVIEQLRNPNLTKDEYDQLANKLKELQDQFNQVRNAAKIFNDGFKNEADLEKYEQNAEAVRMKFEQLQNTYAKLAQSNPQIASKFEEIRQKLEGMDPKNINEVSRSVNNLAKECGIASHQSAGLRGALQDAFGGLGTYISRFASSYFIITKAIQGIKNMVNAVKEVDSSLVELQKVTGLTGAALDQFTDKAYKLGETLGRTGSDVINAAATFSRAGYDLQEATELAQSALVMTNVGVDISSTEAAASDMISILKAFDVQAEDSMDVIDKLYNVANKEPLDFGNITHMLVTAGGTLAQTGTSLEETMGLLTGAFATMRDPAVANGLIMISQRLRGVKEDGEAIEEAGFIPKLKAMFANVGIDIEDSNGELRSTYEILNDLASVWDLLSSKQKQYFGEKIAGNRQVKTLNAIMQNWDVVSDTIDKANNAQGAAVEGNEMYMNSIAGKITQLKSAFQELATETISSDFTKMFVELATNIVKATTAIGGLGPVLTTVLGIFIAIRGTKITEFFTTLGTTIKGIIPAIQGFLSGSQAVTLSLGSWVGIAIAVAGALYGIVTALSKVNDTTKQLEKAKDNYQKQQDVVKNLNLELENTQSRIDELNGKELTIVEQKELEKLQDTNKELQTQIDLENKLLEIADREQRNAAVKDINKYQSQDAKSGTIKPYEYMNRVSTKDLLEIAGYDYSSMTPTQQSDAISSIAFTNDMMADLNAKALVAAKEEYKKAYEDYLGLAEDADDEMVQQSKQNLDNLKTEIQKYENELSSYYNTLKDKTDGISESEDNPEFTAIKERMKEIGSYLIDDTDIPFEDALNKVLSQFPNTVALIKEQVNELGDAFDVDTIEDNLSDANKKIIKGTNDLIDSLTQIENIEDPSEKIKEILRNMFMTGDGAGNVDVTNRKVLSGKDMLEKYKEDFEGFEDAIVTYYSHGEAIEIGGIPFEFTITPIGPDGTVYSEDKIYEYIDELLGKSSDINEFLANDKLKNGGKQIFLHYTPVIGDDYETAAAIEEYYGNVLHTLSSVVDGDTELQDAIDELGEKIDINEFLNILGDKLGLAHDEMQQMFIETFKVDTKSVNMFAVGLEDVELYSATESYKTLTAAMTEQQKAGALSAETLQKLMSDEGWEGLSDCLQRTANGYILNTEAVKKYIKAEEEERRLKATAAIMEREYRIKELQAALSDLTSEEIDAGREAELLGEIAGLEQQIMQFQAVKDEIDNATDALARYREASKTPNQDAEYTEGQGIYKVVKEAYEYGKVGTDDFKSGMDFLLGDGWFERFNGDLDKAYKAAKKIGERYFGEDEAISGMNFAKDLQNLRINGEAVVEYDKLTDSIKMVTDENGNYKFSLEEIAEAFGTSTAAAASFFGLLNAYSYGNQFTFESEITSAEELAAAIKKLNEMKEEQARLEKEITEAEESGDTTGIEEKKKRYDELGESITGLESAVKTAEEAVENGEFEAPQTLEDALAKIQELEDAIKNFEGNNITVPVELTGDYESLMKLLAGEGEEDGLWTVTVNDTGDAAEKLKTVQGLLAQIRNNPTISPKIKAEIIGNLEGMEGALNEYLGQADEVKEKFPDGKMTATIEFDASNHRYKIVYNEVKDDLDELEKNPAKIGFEENEEKSGKKVKEQVEEEVDGVEVEVGVKEDEKDNSATLKKSIEDTLDGLKATIKTEIDSTTKKITEKALDDITKDRTIKIKTINVGDEIEVPRSMSSNDQQYKYVKRGLDKSNISIGAEKKSNDAYEYVDPVDYTQRVIKGLYNKNNNKVPFNDEIEAQLKQRIADGALALSDDVVSNLSNVIDGAVESFNYGLYNDQNYFESIVPIEPVEIPTEIDSDGLQEDIESAVSEANPELEVDVDGDGIKDAVDESTPDSETVDVEPGKLQEYTQGIHDATPDQETVTINQATGSNASVDVPDSVTTTVNANTDGATRSVDSLHNKASKGETMTVDADTTQGEKEVDDLHSDAKKPETMNVYTTVWRKMLDDLLNDIKTAKTLFIDVYYRNKNSPPQRNAKGTKNAKSGLSLVDEKGAELIEHTSRGTFELGTDNGPRFTNLDKGDVVHTASETKTILNRLGDIGGFFRDGMNKAKSVIGGAFAGGRVGGSVGLGSLRRGAKKEKEDSEKKKKKRSGSSSSSSSSKNPFREWAEELFDWAEIRLDYLKRKTESILVDVANTVGAVGKNLKLDLAMKSVDKQIRQTNQAMELYLSQAQKVANKGNLSADIIKKIQHGSIDISKYDKDMQEIIKEYQEWYNKAMACSDALAELAEQQKEIAKQRIDNVISEYDYDFETYDIQTRTEQAKRERKYYEGKQDNKSDYDREIGIEEDRRKGLIEERQKIEDELEKGLIEGSIVVGDDTYNETMQKLRDIDASVIEVDNTISKLHQDANNVELEKLQYELDAVTESANRTSEAMDLDTARGSRSIGSMTTDYKKLISDAEEENRILEEQNEKYKKLQEGMDPLSDRYQEIEKEIQNNTSAINKNLLAIEGYKDKIAQTPIAENLYEYDELADEADKISGEIAHKEATGVEVTKKDYKSLIDNGNAQIENLERRKKSYQTLMDVMVETYGEEARGSEKYKQFEDAVRGIDSAIQSTKTSMANWNNDMFNIDVDKLQTASDKIDNEISEIEDNLKRGISEGSIKLSKEADGYENIIKQLGNQNSVLEEQNKLYEEEQKGLDKNSKRYKELDAAIESNKKKIRDNEQAIIDYSNTIDEIPIEKLEYKLDRLGDLADLRESKIDLKDLTGKAVKKSDYQYLINNADSRMSVLQSEKDYYTQKMEDMVAEQGEGAKQSREYKELANKVREADKAMMSLEISTAKWRNEAAQLDIDKLSWKYESLESSADQYRNTLDLGISQGTIGIDKEATMYGDLIVKLKNQNSVLEDQNELYLKQQEGLDKNSKRYHELETAINRNNQTIQNNNKTMQEYSETIDNIPLEKLEYKFDELSDYADEADNSISLKLASGKEITENDYQSLINNGNQRLGNIRARRAILANRLANFTGDKNSREYKELADEARELDKEFGNLTLSIVEWENEANNVKLDRLAWQLDKVNAEVDRLNDSLDLHSSQGYEETSDIYEDLINKGTERIKILEEENDYYRQLQEGMDVESKAYQELQSKINSNLSTINDIKVAQEGWNDSIIDIGINQIQKYKNALSKTNDEYKKQKELTSAIQDLEKAQYQRKTRTYIEGEGFVFQSSADDIKSAQERLEEVITGQLFDKLDDLIDALEEEKKDSNVYDANGNLIGERYTLPDIGSLGTVLSNYDTARLNDLVLNKALLSDSLGDAFASSMGNIAGKSYSTLNIGDIIVNEAKDGNDLAKAIINQFPNALLQALYNK